MTSPNHEYVVEQAGQVAAWHRDLLTAENDDLALLRGLLALVTAFIHNPAYDDIARRALVHTLGLPEPTPEQQARAIDALNEQALRCRPGAREIEPKPTLRTARQENAS